MHPDQRYWIAINGASCARTSLPLRAPLVTPTPEMLVGFLTDEEAREAQRVCLHASIKDVDQFLKAALRDGRVRLIQPEHPQPPTRGPTMWSDDPELHAVAQQVHIKTTAN